MLREELPHDRCQVNARSVDMRKIGIRFVEDQREFRPSQNNSFHSLALAQSMSDRTEHLIMFLRSTPSVYDLHIRCVDEIDLIGPRDHDLDTWQLTEHSSFHGEACAKKRNALQLPDVNLVENCRGEAHQRNWGDLQ